MPRHRAPEPASPRRAPPEGGAPPAEPPAKRYVPPPAQWSRRHYLRCSAPLPWHVCFVLGVFAFVKLQAVWDAPCAILGAPSPATKQSVARAYRQLSLCTHPDKAEAGGDRRRAEVLFLRATRAKDALLARLAQPPAAALAAWHRAEVARVYAAHNPARLGEVGARRSRRSREARARRG